MRTDGRTDNAVSPVCSFDVCHVKKGNEQYAAAYVGLLEGKIKHFMRI